MTASVHVHEDDWGLLTLELAENRAEREAAAREAQAFGAAHRAPDGLAWTDAMVLPPVTIPLRTRGIAPGALREALGADVVATRRLTVGYGSRADPVTGGFAYSLDPAEAYWNVLFGTVAGDAVTSLQLTTATSAIAPVLSRLGATFGLILCDFRADVVVDLGDRAALDAYLADEE